MSSIRAVKFIGHKTGSLGPTGLYIRAARIQVSITYTTEYIHVEGEENKRRVVTELYSVALPMIVTMIAKTLLYIWVPALLQFVSSTTNLKRNMTANLRNRLSHIMSS